MSKCPGCGSKDVVFLERPCLKNRWYWKYRIKYKFYSIIWWYKEHILGYEWEKIYEGTDPEEADRAVEKAKSERR